VLRVIDSRGCIGKHAAIVFKTTHIDRAGETGAHRVVQAEIVEIDLAGDALLVSEDDYHVRFPVAELHALPKGKRRGLAGLKGVSFLGGQEVIRDFHNAIEPVSLRWLDLAAILGLLAQ
jgi:hypothetical protein